jgi:tetratricopeptide (TPR) repeat protein
LRFYREFLASENSADFIRSVVGRYTPTALERLTASPDRVTRRAAVLALGLTADYSANAALGRALLDADRTVRILAENGLRAVWRRQGNETQRRLLEQVIRLNRAGDLDSAIARASELLHQAPWIAETSHQRGLAYFHQGRYYAALDDFAQTLELNAYHFAAAVGMGHCHLHLDDTTAALECFERALRLNPDLEGVRAQIRYLKRSPDRKS